jgi:hypothetical protein
MALSARPSPDSQGSPPGAPAPAVVRALRKVLRPLVKLMLANGLTYPYLSDLLKGLFVGVADQDFRLGDKPSTDSRISLVSGVHRKDVSRLRAQMQSSEEVVSSVVPLGAQLVAHWMSHSTYLTDDAQPSPLARLVSEGGDRSFEALVAGVNVDIRSRVVLDEWLRLGVVSLDDEGRVCLNASAFIPTRGADEKAYYLGHNLHDHAAAAVHNLLGDGTPFMERSVHYDRLTPDSVQKLAALSEKLGMQTLLAINKAAMEAEETDRLVNAKTDAASPDQRFTLGLYFYSTGAEEPNEDDSQPT